MLILDLCNYSDAYIVVRATTDFLAAASREYDKAGNNFILKRQCSIHFIYIKN